MEDKVQGMNKGPGSMGEISDRQDSTPGTAGQGQGFGSKETGHVQGGNLGSGGASVPDR